MSTFDPDARELAKDAIAFYSRYANPLLLDALIDAARWAVAVTDGEYVLVEKVNGKWPLTNRVFDAIEDALVRKTGLASMRTIETVVETYLDALAEGER